MVLERRKGVVVAGLDGGGVVELKQRECLVM